MKSDNSAITDEMVAAYAHETADILRYVLRRTVDACTATEIQARGGPAGIDQAVATVQDLRAEMFRVADLWLPGEQLMEYADNSAITDNTMTSSGLIARQYRAWPAVFTDRAADTIPEGRQSNDD